VGIGEVTGEMVKVRDVTVEIGGEEVPLLDQPDIPAELRQRADSDDDDVTEYAVLVQWLASRPASEAVSERGLFASQVTACKLRDERTINVVTSALGVES
jgi:hypothetical protein